MHRHIYDITGMTCNGCRNIVEKKLNEIPEVTAKVDLIKATAEISSPSHIPLQLLQEKLQELGGQYQIHAHGEGSHTPLKTPDDIPDSPSQQYICPMFCEGKDSIYHEKGRCPVCHMFLMPVEQVDFNAEIKHQGPDLSKAGKYYCPMMCEGDKVYDEFGSCPVCGMNLEKIPDTSMKITFSCPMHPEVVSDKPGTCPVCGMDLVANMPEEEEDVVYKDWQKKLIVSIAFALPVFILSMGDMLPGQPISKIISPQLSGWVQLLLTLPVRSEVVSDKPGTCPVCGMDLVANMPEEEEDVVYKDWQKKLIVSIAFALPVFILSMGDMLPGQPISKIISPQLSGWVQLLLTLPV